VLSVPGGGGVSCIFAETVAWVLLSGPAEQHCGAFCGRVFAVCACWWCGVISACSQLQKGGGGVLGSMLSVGPIVCSTSSSPFVWQNFLCCR
jgi:hypothetical protein